MACLQDDFKIDFINLYSDEAYEEIEKLIDAALQSNEPVIKISGDWCVSSSIEKNDRLNYTYYIDISKDNEEAGHDDDEICLTYYTGVDVGCELIDFSLDGVSIKHSLKTVSVLDDISVNWSLYPEGRNKKLIESVFNSHKDKILDIYKKMDYDNYVTGGGSRKTKSYYSDALNEYIVKGIHWTCEYKDIEVDRNMI